MNYLPGLDEYYQPPDPAPFIPGDVTYPQHIALMTFLSWYDDALDYTDVLEAVKEGREEFFSWRDEFAELEVDELVEKIETLSNLIKKYATQIYKEIK